ncbi:polymer-forming cytoskeletal protein [Burkholderia pseudomallei]|uniref:polymer-forming cytoskeletal protein n=1 Tax=Burkholderia pseudomallei TaxID=28450 RepID=UPI00050DB2CF|nr:polymer-forming cytoskeletal protein [Burkholderia pseudomallei]KGD37543.1 polymer-forming cytoskeletal family protein [Burkholderia pseudomallei]
MTTFNVMMPVAGVLALPFLPLLNELVRRSDVDALPIGEGPCVDYPRRAAQWLDALRASARGAPPAPDDAPPPWQALGLQAVRVHGCGGFANLHGTPIVFGRLAHAPGRDAALTPRRAMSLSGRLAGVPHRVLGGRYLVARDIRLPSHTILHGTLIVDGRLTLGEGCVLIGSVKAHSVVLECDALLNGAVFARDDVLLDEASCIDGVVSAGGLLWLKGARIGAADHPVSACARDVSVVGHACVHGDLVAWRSGWYHAS